MTNKSKEKTVLFIGPWPPPYGGIASNLKELLPDLKKHRINPICLHCCGKKNQIIIEQGVRIIQFNLKQELLLNPKTLWLSIFFWKNHYAQNFKQILMQTIIAEKIKKIIRQYGVRVLFSYGNDILLSLRLLKPCLKNISFFPTIYNEFLWNPTLFENYKLDLTEVLKESTTILSCSNFCAKTFQKFLNFQHPYLRIFNNVDEKKYFPQKKRLNLLQKYKLSKENIVLLILGRFEPQMGFKWILNHLDKILNTDSKLVLILAGATGSMTKEVLNTCKKIKQCRVFVNVNEAKKIELFSICDVFSAPSVWNHPCLGIANLEAMMCGKPVLSSATGGHCEGVQNKKTGFLVGFKNKTLNIDDYLNKLNYLLKQKTKRLHMGSYARKWALKNFSSNKITREHLALINSKN